MGLENSLSRNSETAIVGDLKHFTDWGGHIRAFPEY